jgi:hypothetical protein
MKRYSPGSLRQMIRLHRFLTETTHINNHQKPMKQLIQFTQARAAARRSGILIILLLACFAGLQQAQAVIPAPDGGYPGGNTAEGQNALLSLTSGTYNTAVGFFSLRSNTEGNFNTGVGAGTLLLNTGFQNTATGAAALLSNTTGIQNSAYGAFALFSNTDGSFNTATGDQALFSNTGGEQNTATGFQALVFNTTGDFNTANGSGALRSNITASGNTATGAGALGSNTMGGDNTANGTFALLNNTEGNSNTALGRDALFANTNGNDNTASGRSALGNNTTGDFNTAIGVSALANNIIGSDNTAIGNNAGVSITAGGNVCIGADVSGEPGVQNTTYIRNIASTAQNNGFYVTVDPNTGRLGFANTSSKRYKEKIQPLDKVSEAILELRPITFRYKSGVDASNLPQFGLIAEEVAKANPDLVTYNDKGEVFTVRYDAINVMLLNEFLKEHNKVEAQQATITELQSTVARQQEDFQSKLGEQEKQIAALASGLQKVSVQLATAITSSGGTPPKLVAKSP